jgi:catalase
MTKPLNSDAIDHLARQIFETMAQVPGTRAGHRVVHAKGLVCEGTFTPSREANTFSQAGHLAGPDVPVTVRFSDGAPDPFVPDNSAFAGPRGIAIRFNLPGGKTTDIVAISHNGFVVGTGEEFLALQKAVLATDPTKPHPWPIEQFLGGHPVALKFVQENAIVPESFATEAFFSNDSFVFVNKSGARQMMRYKILPSAGIRHLSEEAAKTKSPDYLIDDLKSRLAKAPIQFALAAQLPNPGDPTHDPSIVWPSDRKEISLGIINLTSVAPDNAAAERALAYFPTNLVDGIELSDDPFPDLRSRVYLLASNHRQNKVNG